MKKVTVYHADWCSWCHKLMDFLDENKIEYTSKNVDVNENAEESMSVSGQGGIPVTVIDGEVVIGFDVNRLKELLEI